MWSLKVREKKLKRNVKHFHRKKKSKQKRNHKNMKQKQNDIETTTILPALNYMNDMDWYQIIKSDSSDDDNNMTTEDAQKLDLLDSI